MPDREKVIEGFEMSYKYSNVDESNTLVPQQLVLDAIALLKAQEPVEPIQDMVGDALFWVCGKCGHDISSSDWYCANCGRAVKWDG